MARKIKVTTTNSDWESGQAKFLPLPSDWDQKDEDAQEEYLDELADANIGDFDSVDAEVVDDDADDWDSAEGETC